jgi:hypothetical protein
MRFVGLRSWSWKSDNSDGYSSTFKLEIGAPSGLSHAPLLPGFPATSAVSSPCSDFDAAIDGLVPIKLTIRNVTRGFAETAGAGLLSDRASAEAVANYSSGATCEQFDNASTWGSSCQLEPGQKCQTYGYLILPNFFSPNAPKGDASLLADIVLSAVDDSTPEQNVTGGTGPGGGSDLMSSPTYYSFNLAGKPLF